MLAGGKFAYGAQTATMDYLFNELAGRWGASYDENETSSHYRLTGILMQQSDVNFRTSDCGYYWTEVLGGDKFEWWRANEIDSGSKITDLITEIRGVKGLLNAGEPNDPHQQLLIDRVHLVIAPRGTNSSLLFSAIRNYAENYSGSWSLLGPNCRPFQNDIVTKFNLRIEAPKNLTAIKSPTS